MPFKDYTEFVEPLRLPYRGVVFEVPPMGIEAGLRLTQALDPESTESVSDDELKDLLFGAMAEKLQGLPVDVVGRFVLTALADFQGGREAAEAIWEAGADPKAIERWVGARKVEASEPSTSTAAAPTTRSRARGSGTTSRKATPAP